MKRTQQILWSAAALLVAAAGLFLWTALEDRPAREALVIAMPRGEFIRNMESNYYKLWLEQQTGLSLSFVYLEDGYTAEYLENAFASGDVPVDAFFSFDTGISYLSTLSMLEEFGEKGYILPVDAYLDGATNLERIFSEFTAYDLREMMKSPNGSIYFMPGLDASRGQSTRSILWLNKSWLSAMRLAVPRTTQQLHEVLEAFRTGDPNGNGLADEIPLCGTLESGGQRLYDAVINAFVYSDPDNSYLLAHNGAVAFAPVTGEWRGAMQYLNRLYEGGLISPLLLELSGRAFSELANNPANLLGGFTADHITDVLLQNSPEVLSNFIHVPPLEGPYGGQNATFRITLPRVSGVITASCANPQAVFRLFDTMLSEEAFLIGRYGEEHVDWETAKITDMDFYDHSATIRILNQLANKMQNKHFCELGPFYATPKYVDGVSFAGMESDQEYINARAVRAYEQYMPRERLGAALYLAQESDELQGLRTGIDAYTQECILGFLTGALDPYDDSVWQDVCRRYEALGLPRLLAAAQVSYTTMNGADT